MPEKTAEKSLLTIAIAEDDSAIARVLKDKLTRSGYQVLTAVSNGADAIELVRVHRPQVLLLDWYMPVMDGFQALSKIQAFKTTAVVMMTADERAEHARRALEAGVNGYILKPFEAAQSIPMLESAWHLFQQVGHLQQENHDLQEALATRKMLDQAKGILMEQQGYTEQEAHRMLQKMSQDQGIPLKDVCRSLIQVKLVLGRNAARTAKTQSK